MSAKCGSGSHTPRVPVRQEMNGAEGLRSPDFRLANGNLRVMRAKAKENTDTMSATTLVRNGKCGSGCGSRLGGWTVGLMAVVWALGCDTEVAVPIPPDQAVDCIAFVCERLPACSAITFMRWRAWDWRSYDACMATMTCSDPERCMDAVDAMVCQGPGYEEGVDKVRIACGATRSLPASGERALLPVPMK